MRLTLQNLGPARVILLSALIAASCALPSYSVGDTSGTESAGTATSTGASNSSASSGAGGAGSTGTSSSTGEGGSGGCAVDDECAKIAPLCQVGVCTNGQCEFSPAQNDSNTDVKPEAQGDCTSYFCNEGQVTPMSNSNDPYDDGNPCTNDTCNGTSPVHEPVTDSQIGCQFLGPAGGDGFCSNGQCVKCSDTVPCQNAGPCFEGQCFMETCKNGVKDQGEVGTDCGGSCFPCPPGTMGCMFDADCISHLCQAGTCTQPDCTDGTQNGIESDKDCGGQCQPCADGLKCKFPSDCKSKVCFGGACKSPTCVDGQYNGAETGPDCGGPDCPPCP
jgi:hypothetical protein